MTFLKGKNMETFTVKNKQGFYTVGSKKRTKVKKSLSIEGLYGILTDTRNKDLLDNLKLTDNKQQKVSFDIDGNNGIFILKTPNKTQEFIYSSTKGIKKIKEEIVSFNGKTREYIEYHKNGNKKLKMQILSNGTKEYILEEYDKNDNIVKTTEPTMDNNDNFETIKQNNFLGHKQNFYLGDEYVIEKKFRELGITVNRNDLKYFDGSDVYTLSKEEEDKINNEVCRKFGYNGSYENLLRKAIEDKNNDLCVEIVNFKYKLFLNKTVEFLKENSLKIKKSSKKMDYTSEKIVTEYSIVDKDKKVTFELPDTREFNDDDKLSVKICDNGELKLACNNNYIDTGQKYYFTIPSKSDTIYIFDNKKGEHHSNFKWDKEKNPNFSVIAAGCFILDEKGKIAKIVNDSGHFKPISRDCTESFLRTLSKNLVVSLKEDGLDIKSKGLGNLLSENKKVGKDGYNISVDITKCGGIEERNNITLYSNEPDGATSTITKRKIQLIDENTRKNFVIRGKV